MSKFQAVCLLIVFCYAVFYVGAATLVMEIDERLNGGSITKRNGAASLVNRLIQNENKPMYGAGVDRTVLTMSRNVNQSITAKNIPKIDNVWKNLENMRCNGSHFHHTCYQVTGINAVGLFFTFDIVYHNHSFDVTTTLDNKHQAIKLTNNAVKYLNMKDKRLPMLTIVFFNVRAYQHNRRVCASVTTTIKGVHYLRYLGCFINHSN